MNKLLVCIQILACIGCGAASAEQFDFSALNKEELAQLLFDELERLDGNAIYVRNKTKNVKWPEFRAAMTEQIVRAETKQSLAMAIDAVRQGFTNSHAAIQPYQVVYSIPTLYEDSPDKRGFEIGYTYPEIRFFSLANGEWISHVNNIELAQRYYQFEQYECHLAHQNGCLNKFVNRIRTGWARLNIQDEVNLKGGNGAQWLESVNSPNPNTPLSNTSNDNYCAAYAEEYPDFTLDYAGTNLCLLTKANTVLLRIRSFGNWGAPQDDFYCYGEAKPESLCNDVQMLSQALSERKQLRMVIDVQDNRGGAENTPLLSLLSKGGFKDNLIQYRYTHEMLDETFRGYMFYGVESAKTWFSNLDIQQLSQQKPQWLPPRADFCRGGKDCAYLAVPARTPALDIEKLIVVVNAGCASSCDDLVWRLKRDANAYVVGQPPVTDGTYVSATGILYLTPEGALSSTIIGSGQKSTLPPDVTKLVWFQVPYSATLDEQQQILEGSSAVVDSIIPITRENFKQRNRATVQSALSYLR